MRYESYVAIISENASYSKITTVCMKISNFCLNYLMQNASVRSLDLNRPFAEIADSLDRIAYEIFGDTLKRIA